MRAVKKAGTVVKKEPAGAKKAADQPKKAAATKKVKEVGQPAVDACCSRSRLHGFPTQQVTL